LARERSFSEVYCDKISGIGSLKGPQNRPLTTGVDSGEAFVGTALGDTYNATPSTLTAFDSLDGGAGNDTLVLNEVTGLLSAALPANVTLKSIEAIAATSGGTIGTNAATGTAAVAQVVQYTMLVGTAGSSTVTYNGLTGNYTQSATTSVSATNFAAAINSIAGQTIAFAGTADAGNSAATSGSTALTLSAANTAIKVGMAVTGTGIAAGTTVSAVSSTAVTLSKATTAAVTTPATFGGGTAAVSVIAPTAGTALPAIVLGTPANADTSAIIANAAAVAGTTAASYNVSGFTDVVSFTGTSVGGANVGAAATQAVTLTNTSGGTTTVAGGLSQTVTTAGGAVALSGSAGAVLLTNTAQGASAITVTGGTSVGVTATGTTTGTVLVGTSPTSASGNSATAASGPSGAVSVSVSSSGGTADFTAGAVTVNGGTSVSVTETVARTGPTAATVGGTALTTTHGAVTVNGGATTASVEVSQTAARTAQNFRKAETGALETVSVKFAALAAGASVTVEGLTFTASATGSGLTAAQVASAFADLAIGAIAGKAGALGTYSGALTTAGVADFFTSGSATGDTVVFVSPTATAAADMVVTGAVVTEVVKAVTAVTGNSQGGIANNAVTVTDVNFTAIGSATGSATGTKLGVIGTVTANNFTTLTVNNSGLNTLNVTGGSGNITIKDGSALAGASVLRGLTVNMGGQTGGILDTTTANVQTLNLALTSASSLADITMNGVTALNLSGSAALSATSATGLAGLSAVKTITLAGGAGLNGTLLTADTAKPLVKAVTGSETLDLSGLTTLTSVDASASTGAIKVKVDTATASVVGGSGNDGITTAATVTKSISTGAGDDTVTLGGVTISANIDGGAGTDVLSMTAADAVTVSGNATSAAVFKSYVSSFEALTLTGAVTTAVVNLGSIGFGANTIVAGTVATKLTLDKFANGGNLVIADANSGTIELTNAVAFAQNTSGTAASYAANSVNIEVTGRTADTFDAKGDRTATNVGSVTGGIVELSNVGTVNISAQDTGSSVTGKVAAHTLTVTDTKAHVVNVVGNADLTLTLGAATVPATVNGSAMTGALTLNLGAKTLSGGFTVTGGAGDDVLTASSVQGDKLSGSAGDDTLTSNAFATTLTGGAGSDTFVISAATAAKTIFTTITDFSAGDTLKLIDVGGGVSETFKSTKTDLSTLGASATLSDALNLAITGAADGEIRWLQFGGDTYVVQNIGAGASTTFNDGTDLVVRLSGTVDLSAMGFNSSLQSLAFA
jgi:S-layer protein